MSLGVLKGGAKQPIAGLFGLSDTEIEMIHESLPPVTEITDDSDKAATTTAIKEYVAGNEVQAGSGLTKDSTTTPHTIKHSNSITAGTAGTSSATNGFVAAIPYVTYDSNGHISATGTHNHTVNTASLPSTSTAATSTASAISTYVRNQNILSAYESYVVGTSNQTVGYDGVISFMWGTTSSAQNKIVYINNTLVLGDNMAGRVYGELSVKKGDVIRAGVSITASARWYKNRDYTGR